MSYMDWERRGLTDDCGKCGTRVEPVLRPIGRGRDGEPLWEAVWTCPTCRRAWGSTAAWALPASRLPAYARARVLLPDGRPVEGPVDLGVTPRG